MSRNMNPRIKIGIRMHDMPSGTIEERIAMAGKCGYSCAHVALSKLIGEYSVADGALTPGFAMYLKELFAENHVDIAVLGCYLNLATPDQEEWESSFYQYKAQLRFASLLGCGVVGTETGAPNKEYRPVPECRSEEAFQILLHRLRKVVDCAEQAGAILAIEPVVRHIIYDAERAKRLLEEINSTNLQIIFDPVNLLDSSNYQEREAIFDLFLETLGKDIAVIHLKDFKVEGGELKFCAPGLGEMDYRRIFSYLKKEKPYIHTIMEETLPENAEAAMKYLYGVYNKEFNCPNIKKYQSRQTCVAVTACRTCPGILTAGGKNVNFHARNCTKFVSYKDIKGLMADLKRVYAAPTEEVALAELELFKEKWDAKYPKIYKSWHDSWATLSTYFKYPEAVRRLIYTTNAIEGFNRQLRKVTKSKTVFPTDDSLLKMLYLAMMDITKKWTSHRQDWGRSVPSWRFILRNAFRGGICKEGYFRHARLTCREIPV